MEKITLSRSLEDYLEAIYNLKIKNGTIRVTDLAEIMGVSKPSVNQALTSLASMELIKYEKYEPVVLTEKGQEKAKEIFKLHVLLKNFLIKALNIPEKIAEIDACKMEHIISKETISGIVDYMDKYRYYSST